MLMSNILKNSTKKLAFDYTKSHGFLLNNPFLKIQLKNVSRSLTSRENREKNDLKKMDDYWETVDKDFNRRLDILKQIEDKLQTKTESLISSTGKFKEEVKKIYYIPLTNSDEMILKYYIKPEKHSDIRKGGRVVLLDEVNKYNRKYIYRRINFNFEPLDYEDIQNIKKNYQFLLSNRDIFAFTLQRGKEIFNFLDDFKNYRAECLENFSYYFRKIEHFEACKENKPLKDNIDIDMKKIENSTWINKLLKNNKINENVLSEKFKDIYSNYLDFVNKEVSKRQPYDFEFISMNKFAEKKENVISQLKKDVENIEKILDNVVVVIDNFEIKDNEMLISTDEENKSDEENESDEENNSDEENKSDEEINEKLDKYEELVEEIIKAYENISNYNEVELKENEDLKTKMKNMEESLKQSSEKYEIIKEENYKNNFNGEELNEKEIKLKESIDFIKSIDEEIEKEEEEFSKSFEGRKLLKLIKKERECLELLELNEKESNIIFEMGKNPEQNVDKLIKEFRDETETLGEIDECKEGEEGENQIKDDKELVNLHDDYVNFDNQKEIEDKENLYENEENFPYYDLYEINKDIIQYIKENTSLKYSDKDEFFILEILMKYFVDVTQSKYQIFCDEKLELEYLGSLKSYKEYDDELKLLDELENRDNLLEKEYIDNEVTDEEKMNPEYYFTPNFKLLLNHLNEKFGVVDKLVFDYRNNINTPNYSYPNNVYNFDYILYKNDPISQEIVNFYLDLTNENNLLKENDIEKICIAVDKFLEEIENESEDEFDSNKEVGENNLLVESKELVEPQKDSEIPKNELAESKEKSDSLKDADMLNKEFEEIDESEEDEVEIFHKDEKYKPDEFYHNIIDANLINRIDTFSEKIYNEKSTFKIINSEKLNELNNNNSLLKNGEIVESILIKGLFQNRLLNHTPESYFVLDNFDNLGIKYYMHKSFKGSNEFTDEDPYLFSFNQNETSLNEKFSLIKKRDLKIILRMYYKISDSSKILYSKKDEPINFDFDDIKDLKHLLVFENELIAPNNLFLLNHSFEDWIANHTIEMNNWKLVDVDNFMKGNSYFYNKSGAEILIDRNLNDLNFVAESMENYFCEEDGDFEENKVGEALETVSVELEKPIEEKAGNKDKNLEKEDKKSKKDKKEKKDSKKEPKDSAIVENNNITKEKLTKNTNLSYSYNVDYLYDIKVSKEFKEFQKDMKNFHELADKEIIKTLINDKQKSQIDQLANNQNEFYDKFSDFFDKDLLIKEIERNLSTDFIEESESEEMNYVKELNAKRSIELDDLITSYKDLLESNKKLKEFKGLNKSIPIKFEEEEKQEETNKDNIPPPKYKKNVDANVISNDEKISRMISSHLHSILKKYDVKKIESEERIKI